MRFFITAALSPFVAMAHSPDAERENHLAETSMKSELVDATKESAVGLINPSTLAGCDTVQGSTPKVCMGEVVLTANCAACHAGSGPGLMAGSVSANQMSDGELFKYLGMPHPARNLKGAKVFEGIKNPEDRSNLIAYLKSVVPSTN